VKGIFVVYPEKEYAQQVKDSMKAYLASKGVEEVGKQNFVVVVVDFMSFITSPPPPNKFEISIGTSPTKIAKKDYYSQVAMDIIEKAVYGTLDAAHRYVVSTDTLFGVLFCFGCLFICIFNVMINVRPAMSFIWL
jgi:hypothetical protein